MSFDAEAMSENSEKERPRPALDGRVVSFPKTGRTLLSRMYVLYSCKRLASRYPEAEMLIEGRRLSNRPEGHPKFDELMLLAKEAGASLPYVQFLHPGMWHAGGPLQTEEKFLRLRSRLPAIFIVRDPRDTVVSFYHHVHHHKQRERVLSDGSISKPDPCMSNFIRDAIYGIPMICRYMRSIVSVAQKGNVEYRLLTFEQLRHKRAWALRNFLSFLGNSDVDEGAFKFAVDETDFALSQARELEARRLRLEGSGSSASEISIDALRARKGLVGGYKDELGPEDVAWSNAYMERALPEVFRDMYLQTE